MSNREFAKTILWEVMIKPIPKLIAVYWATMIGTLGLTCGIACCVAKFCKNKK